MSTPTWMERMRQVPLLWIGAIKLSTLPLAMHILWWIFINDLVNLNEFKVLVKTYTFKSLTCPIH